MTSHLTILKDAGIEDAARELRLLERNFSEDDLDIAVNKRAQHIPMAQILGYRDFWKSRFIVNEYVLDPRPDSELFLDILLNSGREFQSILDMGTGTGALALSALLEFGSAKATLSDNSERGLDVAQQNAQTLGLAARCQFLRSDWFENIEGQFDLILCNPPYLSEHEMKRAQEELKYEPENALTDGADGLSAYREIAPNLGQYLAKNGLALFEHGYKQQNEVAQIFENQGYKTEKYADLSNNPRIVAVFL